MGRETNIEWCDSTINGSSGCDGCELWTPEVRTCYAGNLQTNRLSKSLPALYSPKFTEVRMIPGRFAKAAAWSDLRGVDRPNKPWLNGMPRCIFVGDMGDFLSREVTDDYLEKELLGAIRSKQGQRHFWMLLTKRPGRLARLSVKWGGLPDNVMAMTTVTDQRTAEARINSLMAVQCHWRGLSCEPLLGPIDFRKIPGFNKAGSEGAEMLWHFWVIAGGESGPGARPMHPDWVRALRDQCANAQVPFFFKQWGRWAPGWSQDEYTEDAPLTCIKPSGELSWWAGNVDTSYNYSSNYEETDVGMERIGKKEAGRLLDWKEHNGFPVLERRTV